MVILAALLGACSSTPVATPPAAKPAAAAPAQTPAAPPPAAPAGTGPVSTVLPAYLDPKSDISTKRSVYFDFDQALVKPEFAGLIERHGTYLIANPKLAIRIEGNTDERGSAEYNLALGQKRAEAVRQALKVYGVPESRMDAVSWGKEKPFCTQSDESCYQQNRRGHFTQNKN